MVTPNEQRSGVVVQATGGSRSASAAVFSGRPRKAVPKAWEISSSADGDSRRQGVYVRDMPQSVVG